MPVKIYKKYNHPLLNVLLIGLLTGTLDAIAAIVWNYKIKASIIFQFIASGVFGKAAFIGGAKMVVWGVLLHYAIAYIFTAIFYLAYPYAIVQLKNKYLAGVMYGIITWLVMNLFVVPLSRIGPMHIPVNAIITGIIILIICVGLPVALISSKLYARNK